MRRTGTYRHCSSVRVTVVRAPNTAVPMFGKSRRQLTPIGFRTPWRWSVIRPRSTTPVVFFVVAWNPAGAFHTPRLTSVAAKIPATVGLGGISLTWPAGLVAAPVTGSGDVKYGK